METSATHPTGTRLVISPRPAHDGLLLRARTWLLHYRLDNEIARAVGRPGDAELALRERQLVGARERRRLAGAVERVLAEADRRPAFSAAVPIDREAVEVARPALTQLALALRSGEPVDPRGVALTLRLLTDAYSPLYLPPGGRPTDPDALCRGVRHVLDTLLPLGAGLTADPSLA
jgi:hypothetical protein